MFTQNKDLYPTPPELAARMIEKVVWRDVKSILEPSAGFGNLIDAVREHNRYSDSKQISAIEIDTKCISYLQSKGARVIDSDFLQYSGLEQFDLIIANFPFSDGDKHLLKAIDVLFNGQVVCLINAETIRNPFSNSRKELVKKLDALDAEIEYIKDAFVDAERKTGVEIALIYFEKKQDVETEIFGGMDTDASNEGIALEDSKEIASKDDIFNIVARYNRDKERVTNQIIEFYRNYSQVSKYLNLVAIGEEIDKYSKGVKIDKRELTTIMKQKLNSFSEKIKKDYWLDAMKLEEISCRLTTKKRQQLSSTLNAYSDMDFTERNIRLFVQRLTETYPTMIEEAILESFDKFTEYSFRDSRLGYVNEYKANIHLYNGWKTNNAFKVNKKIILPFYSGWNGITSLSSNQEDFFHDIDLVFNYFDEKQIENELLMYEDRYSYAKNKTDSTKSTAKIVKISLGLGISKNIKTRYFTVTVYKKGTMHLVFNDLDMLRRFNMYVAKKRGWLPSDYSYSAKRDTSVDFENDKEYKQIPMELSLSYSGGLPMLGLVG